MNSLRALFKGILFAIIIIGFIPAPDTIGKTSLYNHLWPGRERFAFSPRGVPAWLSYNIILNNLPALFSSHKISQPKQPNEFRIIVLGDSSVWGTLLDPDQTIIAALNRKSLSLCEQKVAFYNLGHPYPSVIKDLLILDYALQYQPDYVIWLTTLYAYPIEEQFTVPLLVNNLQRVHELNERYQLSLDLSKPEMAPPSYFGKNIYSQRRNLADWIRHEIYGALWMATGIDQHKWKYDPPPVDFPDSQTEFQNMQPPLNHKTLTYSVIEKSVQKIPIPFLIVNEPMLISQTSKVRYNLAYPRWAYDAWREQMQTIAHQEKWNYLDLWDKIPAPEYYTNAAIHRTPEGEELLANYILPAIRPICLKPH